MKNFSTWIAVGFFTMLFSSCGTSPNDMEKNPFSEEMKARKIKKINDIDLMTYSKEKGKEIVDKLKASSSQQNAAFMDSLQKQGVVIKFLDSVSVIGASQLEQQILDAYLGTPKEQLSDNIQEISKGTFVLYNAPIKDDKGFLGMYSVLFKKDFLVKHLHQSGKF